MGGKQQEAMQENEHQKHRQDIGQLLRIIRHPVYVAAQSGAILQDQTAYDGRCQIPSHMKICSYRLPG